MSAHRTAIPVTIVLPVCNEAESLPPLLKEIGVALSKLPAYSFAVLIVDDGSSDGSLQAAIELQRTHGQHLPITVLQLATRSGKTQALNAAFAHITGDYVVLMDADLQDDPALMGDFLEMLESGCDLAVGNRIGRYRGNLVKRISSRVANGVVRHFAQGSVHDMNCGYKAMTREVALSLRLRSDYHRLIPLLALIQGFRVGEVEIAQRPRQFGKSKYGRAGLGRLAKSLQDMASLIFVYAFEQNPFSFFGRVGFLLLASGFLILSYLTIVWFLGSHIGERPLLQLGILLMLFGGNFLSLGLVGELVVKERAITRYRIKRIFNAPEA